MRVFFTSNRLFGSYFQWKAYTDLQKICSWTRYSNAKLIKNISNLLVALLRFFLSKNNSLGATFNKTRAPTSRIYVAEQGIVMPNWSKTFQTLRSYSSVFDIEKLPKNLNFQSLFTSNRPFRNNFQWKPCTNSKKYVVK